MEAVALLLFSAMFSYIVWFLVEKAKISLGVTYSSYISLLPYFVIIGSFYFALKVIPKESLSAALVLFSLAGFFVGIKIIFIMLGTGRYEIFIGGCLVIILLVITVIAYDEHIGLGEIPQYVDLVATIFAAVMAIFAVLNNSKSS